MPLNHRISRRRLLAAGLGCLSAGAAGCGTILYPERRGQPAGRLDWGVVALDAVGLLLFFVPGVIAFAVDFSNGTIYLPPESYGSTSPSERSLRQVPLSKPHPTLSDVELAVAREIQRDIQLDAPDVVTRELASIEEFWRAADACPVADS